jgi:hypothetical protein
MLVKGDIEMSGLAVVKDSHLTYNGKKYFRGGSEDIELGSYGEKKSPITQTNYLEVQGRIPAEKLKVREAVEISIDTSQTSQKEITTNINAAAVFKGSAGTAYQDFKSGKLKLIKLIIENGDIMSAANQSPKAIDNLSTYGNDARIAHQVFVVVDDETARSFSKGSSFEVSVNVGVVKVSVGANGGSSGSTSVSVSRGSIFAYGMVKLDWDAHSARNKTKITKVTDDQWGPA